VMHPFRFGAMVGQADDRRLWLDQVRMADSLGYSTVLISDHFSDKLAPLPALVMAAEHTALRIGTLVLASDFRHPAVLAKEAATVDLLSGGRLELGIGTGWEEGDYLAAGIARDAPGTQVDRFEEAIEILSGLWSPGPVDYDGEHYQIHVDGLPKPGPGRPTLLIGGGGERMLGLAGRHADIVGISAAELTTRADLARGITRAGDLLDSKLDWIRAGAGERFESLELNILLFGVGVGDRTDEAARLAEQWGGSPEGILASPHFLAGTIDQITADLINRRERWGISYPAVPQAALQSLAPVVQDLTGT
ncbi:MAG: TIGR03621 family F420-dependent LLM class oxidoreductase, partial [Acidimicrobiia bacterium]